LLLRFSCRKRAFCKLDQALEEAGNLEEGIGCNEEQKSQRRPGNDVMMSKRWWVRGQKAGMMIMMMRVMLGQQETRVRVVPTVSASRPSSDIETER